MIEDLLEFYETEMAPPNLANKLMDAPWARGFRRERIHKLVAYIDIHSLNDAQLDLIQACLKNRADESRTGALLFSVTFGALSLIIWNELVTVLIEHFKSHPRALYITVATLMILGTALAILMVMLSWLRDGVVTSYQKYNQLNNLITEARLFRQSRVNQGK